MIRYVVLLPRRPDISRAEFLSTWLGPHRDRLLAVPGVRDVELLPSVDAQDLGLATTFDGLGLVDFEDHATLRAGLGSPEGRALRAHTTSFADSAAALRLLVAPP